MMGEITKIIDLENAIKNGNSKFLRSFPHFAIKLIIKVVRQEEFNSLIYKNREKRGVQFIDGILHDWNIKVVCKGEENIPSSGRFIFAANHPVGGVDALSIFSMINRHFPEVVSPANELLNLIPNLRPLVFGINVFGKADRDTASKLNDLYESDTQIMIFAAGEVSRRKKGRISDLPWQKSFIAKSIQHKRDIIPVFLSGRNSNLFYLVANLRKFLGIKLYIETLLLPREMIKQKNSTATVIIGKPVPYQTFTNEKTHSEWAQWVRSKVYSLTETIN
jgi:1-acyl-sn-glycerol-3-phosphate acyltransferase